MKWICCQLGAREHYAVPRALYQSASLDQLITDAWVPPGKLIGTIRRSLHERFHSDLAQAPVEAWNVGLIMFELKAKADGISDWHLIIARNNWFQRKAHAYLARSTEILKADNPSVFAYSYAARDIFRMAKERGWRTVLGQIDPGPIEEEIVAREVERVPELAAAWQRAPQSYWEQWREECERADTIIVNSEWARSCLMEAGVNGSKLIVIPLAYELPITDTPKTRAYPPRFTRERPLRVLFFGQINLRKGVARLLEAMRFLQNDPVEFIMAGPIQIRGATEAASGCNVRWIGPVTRDAAARHYQEADVFILPTLSDGFALTQLEAQAHGLPVIASRNCGEVVQHGINGLVLEEPSAKAIEAALRVCLNHPEQLARFSGRAVVSNDFSIEKLGQRLVSLPG